MPTVTMPQLGESVAEGTIGKWLKQVGDHVDKFEPIVEVITDKVNAEVPSPFEGVLTQILVPEGETVPNNAEIAVIEASGGAAATAATAPAAADGRGPAAAPVAVARPEAVVDEVQAAGAGRSVAAQTVAGAPAQPAAQAQPAESAPAPAAAAQPAAQAQPAESAPAPAAAAQPAAQAQPAESAPAPAAAAQPATSAPAATTVAPASAPASAPATAFEGRMTPAVRRLAREHEVDLSLVAGTGHGNRVTREDVLKYVTERGTAATPAASASAPAGTAPAPAASAPAVPAPAQTAAASTTPPVPGTPATAAAPPASPVAAGDSLKQLSPMRKAIAAQMNRSLSVPVAYITIEVDMSGVVRRRGSVKGEYQAREGKSLSYVAFVTKACVEALRKHPDLNAHWTDEGHWRRKAVNVGVAVAVDDGLIVPVIRSADTLSLHGLNMAINDLADRSRSNRLKVDDITGGTFTVDNTGWTGSILTLPIINVPEVAIITMEAIVKRPVVLEGPTGDSIAVRSMMNMCLAIDHRATDGAQAGRFLADVKSWLESVDEQTSIW